MLLLLGCLSFGLMLYLFWFLFKGRVMMSFVFQGLFSFCITDFSSPFRVLYQDDHDGETPVSSALSNRSSAVSIG